MFIIESNEGFWSNDYGWVDSLSLCTLFSEKEKEKFDLPIAENSRWVELEI